MDLYASIFSRKSSRSFDKTPINSKKINQIEQFISEVTPLLPQSKLTYEILGPESVKGLGLPKAPHYLLISGKEQPLRNTCAGFLFEQVQLYLFSLGLTCRWLGGVKSKKNNPDHIIGFVFGKSKESCTRTLEEFDRKSLQEIAQGSDSRLEAVRLAPSGMNGQPWYFIKDKNDIYVYYKKSLGGALGLLYHLTDIDIGIALSHLKIASEHEGRPFYFDALEKEYPESPKGYIYVGRVTS
jgi:hypothetical protein